MTARPCPVCGKPADARLRPFCSRRCADVDLGRWLAGSYALPGPGLDEEEAERLTDGDAPLAPLNGRDLS
jgi:uncharacterized protein